MPTKKPCPPVLRDEIAGERLRRFKHIMGEFVRSLKFQGPPTPREYRAFYELHDLGRLYADVVNLPERKWPALVRQCLNCSAELPKGQRRYCDERCKAAAQMRRFRANNPLHKLKRKD